MTHLLKLGPAKPYEAQTQCGEVVSTLLIAGTRPTCEYCAAIYDRVGLEHAAEAQEFLCLP